MTYEHCTECDAETGRAGKHDDSLYHASEGPHCVECYESWTENMICERDQLLADNQRLREAIEQISKWQSHTALFALDYGSNGVRDFYRNIASAALTTANKEPRHDA
jgi:hypothetical protein